MYSAIVRLRPGHRDSKHAEERVRALRLETSPAGMERYITQCLQPSSLPVLMPQCGVSNLLVSWDAALHGTIEDKTTMGRILFLSAVAFMAYKYIARSNQQHQQLPEGDANKVEVLPPSTAALDAKRAPKLSAVEPDRQAHKQLVTASRAVEPDPR